MELTGIEPLVTPNGVALSRGTDDDGWRWSFHPEDYLTPANYYASVTGILDCIVHRKLREWWANQSPADIKAKSGKALDRGVRIHDALAQGKKPRDLKDRLGEIEVAELSIYSTVYGFAGTLDVIRPIDGERTITDYKSGANYGIKTGWQLGAYRMAYGELMGEYLNMAGIHIPPPKPDGREGIQKIFKYEHVDACWLAFLTAFYSWRMLYWTKLARMEWKWLHTPLLVPAAGLT